MSIELGDGEISREGRRGAVDVVGWCGDGCGVKCGCGRRCKVEIRLGKMMIDGVFVEGRIWYAEICESGHWDDSCGC